MNRSKTTSRLLEAEPNTEEEENSTLISCKRCGKLLPEAKLVPHLARAKTCQKAYGEEEFATLKAAARKQSKTRYNLRNRDEINEKQRLYNEENKEHINKRQKAHNEAHREEIKEKQRIYSRGNHW